MDTSIANKRIQWRDIDVEVFYPKDVQIRHAGYTNFCFALGTRKVLDPLEGDEIVLEIGKDAEIHTTLRCIGEIIADKLRDDTVLVVILRATEPADEPDYSSIIDYVVPGSSAEIYTI